MEITAFSKAIKDNFSKLNQTSRFNNVLPSSITYKLRNVFPSSIIAAPLAYGRAELIKTSITFKYDEYFIDRTSRVGGTFAESNASDRIVGRISSGTRNDFELGRGGTRASTDRLGRDFDDPEFGT